MHLPRPPVISPRSVSGVSPWSRPRRHPDNTLRAACSRWRLCPEPFLCRLDGQRAASCLPQASSLCTTWQMRLGLRAERKPPGSFTRGTSHQEQKSGHQRRVLGTCFSTEPQSLLCSAGCRQQLCSPPRPADGWVGTTWVHEHTNGHMDGCMGGWVDRKIDRWMYG